MTFISKKYNKPYFYNTCDNISSWEDTLKPLDIGDRSKLQYCYRNLPWGWKITTSTTKYPGNIYFTNGTVSQWEVPPPDTYSLDELQDIIDNVADDDDRMEQFVTNLPTEALLTMKDVKNIYTEDDAEIRVLEPQSYNSLNKFDRDHFMYSDMEDNDDRHFGLFYNIPGDDKAVSGSGADDWYKLDKPLYDYIVTFK